MLDYETIAALEEDGALDLPMEDRLFVVDLGNVLLQLDFERFVARAAERGTRSREEIRERYIRGESKANFERGQRTSEAFIEELREYLGWPKLAANYERLREIWCDIFDEFPGAQEGLEQLKRLGPVWVLSDTDPLHIQWVSRYYSWALEVDQVLTSYERGKLKRDAGSFESLVRLSELKPKQITFIDDFSDNVEAARRAGLSAILFTTWENVWLELE